MDKKMSEKKILYVEGDLSLIECLKYTLEKNGFQVDNARAIKERYSFTGSCSSLR